MIKGCSTIKIRKRIHCLTDNLGENWHIKWKGKNKAAFLLYAIYKDNLKDMKTFLVKVS